MVSTEIIVEVEHACAESKRMQDGDHLRDFWRRCCIKDMGNALKSFPKSLIACAWRDVAYETIWHLERLHDKALCRWKDSKPSQSASHRLGSP